MKIGHAVDNVSDLSVNTYIPIANFEPEKTYCQTFLVGPIVFNKKMNTKLGEAFARVTLKDISGEITGVIWNYDDELSEGCYAQICITTRLYKNELEFTARANTIKLCDATPLNQYDYIKGSSESSLRSYAQEIENAIMQMGDNIYMDLMANALHRLEILNALKESPYGLDGPLSYRGGLLVHVAHALRFAQVGIRHAVEIETPCNPSLVTAGCVLRNIGWHTTTRFQGDALRPRDAFYMTGIYRASARYVDHLILTTEIDLQATIPEAKKQALENMCNDRSGIRTLEGQIVAAADTMADVLDYGAHILQKKQNGNWSDDLFRGHI